MKTKTMYPILIALALVSAFAFTACNKDDDKTAANDTKVEASMALADKTFNDIGDLAMASLGSGKAGYKSLQGSSAHSSDCLTVSFDLTAIPYKMILDFGNANCLCEDGLNRRGKIIVSYTVTTADSVASLILTLNNFFVNDNQVIGTRTLTYKGHNQAGHSNWDATVDGSIILATGEGTILYQSAHNTEVVEGENTPDYNDNVFSSTGSANGTAVNGQVFSAVITSALISKATCSHFVSGVIDIKPTDQLTRTLDYGTGECDNKATITVAGFTFEFTLP